MLVTQLCPTLCDPCGLQFARLLCLWNSPGKNTGMGCHSLLKGIFPSQGSNPGVLHCRQILYCLSHQGSPYIKRIGLIWWSVFPSRVVHPPCPYPSAIKILLLKKPGQLPCRISHIPDFSVLLEWHLTFPLSSVLCELKVRSKGLIQFRFNFSPG